MRFENLSRRSLVLGGAAATLLVAACSKDKPKPRATTTTTTASSPSTSPSKPTVVAAGLPADLLKVLTDLYLGGTVAASGPAAAALAKRKPLAQPPKVSGATGDWKGSPIAAVSASKDVTLLVKTPKGWQVVGGWWPSLGVARTPSGVKRILAIGSDARPNQKVSGQRADSLHIIGVDDDGVGGIVGIPRDSWVPLASGGTNKINASLVFGGPKGVVGTVERTTGVSIDGYVLTGFKGFRAMINAMGGLRYTSPALFRGEHGILARKGPNLLKGEPALSFARERHTLPNGDFGRSANQGKLILAGMGMVRSGGVAALVKYLTVMSKHVETNLGVSDVLVCAAAALRTDPRSVRNVAVPGSVGTRSGQSVVLLGSGARSVFADIKDGRLRA